MGNLRDAGRQSVALQNMSVRQMCSAPAMVNRFAQVLGGQEKANQFLANVLSSVNANKLLQQCNPVEIMQCAMTAAALNLDVVPGLGFAAIVPYKGHPQMQIMKNGFVQLAMRSGQLRTINVTDVYEDELEDFNILSGELSLKAPADGQRARGETDRIAGYACFVRLANGFEKTVYWTVDEIRRHAEKFSTAYQYDLRSGRNSSPWSTNFPAMAEKTVIKSTISKWVPMSTQMLLAVRADQSTNQNFDIESESAVDAVFTYADNDGGMEAEDSVVGAVIEDAAGTAERGGSGSEANGGRTSGYPQGEPEPAEEFF